MAVGAAVLEKAKEAAEQLSGLAAGILEWSATARERLMGDVTDLIYRVVGEMGLASKKELEALDKRVARLEKSTTGGGKADSEKAKRKRAGSSDKSTARRTDSARSTGSSTDR